MFNFVFIVVSNINIKKNDCISSYNLSTKQRIYSGPNENIFIELCFFERFNVYNSRGGIFFGGDIFLYIQESSFHNCGSQSEGGAIYYDSGTTGNVLFKGVCANWCYCGDGKYGGIHGQFAFIRTATQHSYPIHLTFLSMTACSPYSGEHYHSIKLENGNHTIFGLNSTKNTNQWGSGLTSVRSSIFLCSFSNIIRTYCFAGMNIDLIQISKTNNFFFSNIFNNTAQPYNAIFQVQSSFVNVDQCIFSFNNNILFGATTEVGDSRIIISKSIIDHISNSISFLASITINDHQNIITTEYNTNSYILSHFSTNYCWADIPITPDLTIPIPITPNYSQYPSIPIQTPSITIPLITPKNTMENTISETVYSTPPITLLETPISTLEISPLYTLKPSFENTIPNTLAETLEPTPIVSPENTISNSPIKTSDPSPTYNNNNSKSLFSIIISPFSIFLYIIVIIIIIYYFKNQSKNKYIQVLSNDALI